VEIEAVDDQGAESTVRAELLHDLGCSRLHRGLAEGKEATLRDRGDDGHLLQGQIGTGYPTLLSAVLSRVFF
jgi:hypothetical protein